jgi:charged multivesicular body protein 4A/B
MDDIRDQMDLANEISEAISQPVGFGAEFDEDELNQELEDLEQEELDEKLLDTGIDMAPSVPSSSIPGICCFTLGIPSSKTAIAQAPRPVKKAAVADDVDDELAALQASMAL